VTKAFAVVSAVLCGALALLLTADAVMRATTGGSIRGLFELAERALVMTGCLGLAQAEANRAHVRDTLLTHRLRPAAGNRLRGPPLLLACVFLAWMSIELVERAMNSFVGGEYRTGLLNCPVWPSRAFVAFGTSLLTIVALAKSLVFL